MTSTPSLRRSPFIVRDLSRQAEAFGTEVPVVREKDWKRGSLSLLNVRSDPRFRITLRVYLEDETDVFGAAPIRVSRMSDPTTIAETSVPMDSSHGALLAATGWIDDVARAIALASGRSDPHRGARSRERKPFLGLRQRDERSNAARHDHFAAVRFLDRRV